MPQPQSQPVQQAQGQPAYQLYQSQQYARPQSAQAMPQPQSPQQFQQRAPKTQQTAQQPTSRPAQQSAKQPTQQKPDDESTDKKPDKKTGWKAFRTPIIASVVAVVLVIVGCVGYAAYRVTDHNNEKKIAYSKYLDSKNYDLQEPQIDLPEDNAFELQFDDGVKFDCIKSELDNWGGSKAVDGKYAKVYADAGLTQEIPTNLTVFDDEPHQVRVTPGNVFLYDQTGQKADKSDVNNKRDKDFGSTWYGYGGYYLVRYYGANGKKLKRPEMTYFTVQNDVNSKKFSLDAPTNVSTTVSPKGGLRISWDKVSGADEYRIYMREDDNTTISRKEGNAGSSFSLIGKLKGDKTSFDSIDFDTKLKKAQADAKKTQGSDGYMPNWDFDDQNDSLSHFVVGDTEDDIILNRRIAENKGFDEGLKLSNYVPGNDNVKRVSVSVVAVKGERRSPFQFTSINGLLSRIPVRTASFTEIEAAKDLWDKPVDEFKSQLVAYLSMADGTVKRVAKKLDFDHVVQKADKPSKIYIPFTINNAVLKGYIGVDLEDFGNDIGQVKSIASATFADYEKQGVTTGGLSSMPKMTDAEAEQYKKVKPSTETPDVPYKVNGSTPYVRFIAANLLAGNQVMDITKFKNDGIGSTSFDDAVGEAVYQNPLILAGTYATQVTESKGRSIGIVKLYSTPEASPTSERDELNALFKRVASEITNDGMTPEQKAAAIDAWVCAHIDYDYDAFNASKSVEAGQMTNTERDQQYPHAWNATAVTTGKGVCMSYAYAFKGIADEAGLRSIVVLGNAYGDDGQGGAHAWNLVKASDGSWRTVDSTWNDNGSLSMQDWLMIDQDKPAQGYRKYNSQALVDAQIDSVPGYRAHME